MAVAALLALTGCTAADTGSPEAARAGATRTGAPASLPALATPSPTPTRSPVKWTPKPTSSLPGAYLTVPEYRAQKAERAETRQVYFFSSRWCYSCRVAAKSFEEEGIPTGLTVILVDFDSQTDLKLEYGITLQHTFVQVDSTGHEIHRWTQSLTGDEVWSQTM